MEWAPLGLVLVIISVSMEICRTEHDLFTRSGAKTCRSYISLFEDDISMKIYSECHGGMENGRISLGNHSGRQNSLNQK